MGKRFDTLLFPGGKSKAFTLSYDDGVIQDRRLAELLRQYGLKCTFSLGSGLLGHTETGRAPDGREVDVSKVSPEEVPEVYRTHEIAGHGLYHSALDTIGTPLATYEIIEDKRRLEQLAGRPLKMFAYPFGPMLFYVWGHAYEFDGDGSWQIIEELAKFMSGYENRVWFASNGEIIDYVNAYRRLEYSADGLTIYNPSAVDVTIRTMSESALLPAGRVTRLEPTPL